MRNYLEYLRAAYATGLRRLKCSSWDRVGEERLEDSLSLKVHLIMACSLPEEQQLFSLGKIDLEFRMEKSSLSRRSRGNCHSESYVTDDEDYKTYCMKRKRDPLAPYSNRLKRHSSVKCSENEQTSKTILRVPRLLVPSGPGSSLMQIRRLFNRVTGNRISPDIPE
ncbi:hypothetical protein ANTPLA_LOCUS7490 [Anthophora plagiata]